MWLNFLIWKYFNKRILFQTTASVKCKKIPSRYAINYSGQRSGFVSNIIDVAAVKRVFGFEIHQNFLNKGLSLKKIKNIWFFFQGGSTLYIETCCRPVPKAHPCNGEGLVEGVNGGSSAAAPAPGTLEVTGNLGDVMKESSRIAYTYAKNFLCSLGDENPGAAEYLLTQNVHLHVPEVNA